MQHGHGTSHTHSKQCEIYIGEWVDGRREGKGQLTVWKHCGWSNVIREAAPSCRISVFTEQWERDHGQSLIKLYESKLEGEWREDQIHGEAVFTPKMGSKKYHIYEKGELEFILTESEYQRLKQSM